MSVTHMQIPEMTERQILDMMRPEGPRCNGLRCLIREYLKPGMFMAEIGVFAGAATRMFYDAVGPNGIIYAVDDWKSCGEPWATVLAECVFTDWSRNKRNVIKVKETSPFAATNINDEQFDLIYIDADHRYECVKADLKAWRPKLKKTGIMCGHDFSLPGVQQALREVARKTSVYEDDSWTIDEWETGL